MYGVVLDVVWKFKNVWEGNYKLTVSMIQCTFSALNPSFWTLLGLCRPHLYFVPWLHVRICQSGHKRVAIGWRKKKGHTTSCFLFVPASASCHCHPGNVPWLWLWQFVPTAAADSQTQAHHVSSELPAPVGASSLEVWVQPPRAFHDLRDTSMVKQLPFLKASSVL